jgi:hypothetical protein
MGAAFGIARDISQLEEFSARVPPTRRLDDRVGRSVRLVELIVAAEGIGLEYAGSPTLARCSGHWRSRGL